MSINEERIWAGSETSLQAAKDAEGRASAQAMNHEDDDEDESPRLLSVDGGIATVTIRGSLVNSDSPWLEYFGVTGYPEIRAAMLAAASDPEVKQILLDIDSGGGAVSGCDDTAKLIRLVNDKVKPVATFTDGNMCSAAYWLGCSAGEVYSGKSSLVGSIGIISTFREYSKANEMEGIKVTVMRAGKHKALANPNEPLTPEARAQIQKLLDSAYGIFVDHVAAMRGRSYDYTDKTMADGQEFIGQAAVDVGLTDGLVTYDALITKLKEKVLAIEEKRIDNSVNRNSLIYGHTSTVGLEGATITGKGDQHMAKKALTEADIVALATGATQIDAEANAEGVVSAGATAETDVKAEVNEGAAATAEKEVVAPQESATSAERVNYDAAVQLLNSQLKEKDAALLEAGIKIAGLQAFKDQHEAVIQPLKDIVARSAHIMHVAQGGATRDFASMQPADLVAEHARLAVGFSKFPVGGVAGIATDFNAKNEHAPDMASQARLDAVRFSSKGA